jgi:hypothetical protein
MAACFNNLASHFAIKSLVPLIKTREFGFHPILPFRNGGQFRH